MKNKWILIFLLLLAVVIVGVMVADFKSTRPDQIASNPFEYNVDQYKAVDPALVLYTETRNLQLSMQEPAAIALAGDRLFVAGDQWVQVIGLQGKLISEIPLPEKPHAVAATPDRLLVATKASVLVYDPSGKLLATWKEGFSESSVLTSVAVAGDNIFIADAGQRKVYRFNPSGEKILEFEGKVNDEVLHGFIVPSPCFDVAINADGDLWVANPGKHALENYTFDGNLRGYWNKSSMEVEGFSGCCNPAQFTFLPDGNFITSEKGLVRIKEYKPSGELVGVVAPPAKFQDDGHAPEVVADAESRIYALDFDRKMIRVFEKKER